MTLFQGRDVGPYHILTLKEVDSTNRYALRNLGTLPDRQVITADKQTDGYGRLGREWVSTVPGNIYMSIVLKPLGQSAGRDAAPATEPSNGNADDYAYEALPLANLTQYMSVVLCRALLEYGVDAEIKWPNDVLVQGRKLAGILAESKFQGSRFTGYVLGSGINLNMTHKDLESIDQPAVSLCVLVGKTVDRSAFLELLLGMFFSGYAPFLEKGFPSIQTEYAARSSYLGKRIVVLSHKGRQAGVARRFTDRGLLVFKADKGDEVELAAGDIQSVSEQATP